MVKREGGIVNAVRQQSIMIMLLGLLLISFAVKVANVKNNYTELHRKVNDNRIEIEGIKNEIKVKKPNNMVDDRALYLDLYGKRF